MTRPELFFFSLLQGRKHVLKTRSIDGISQTKNDEYNLVPVHFPWQKRGEDGICIQSAFLTRWGNAEIYGFGKQEACRALIIRRPRSYVCISPTELTISK